MRGQIIGESPATGLDPLATRNVDEMIPGACERYKVTSVAISHDMASVFRIADLRASGVSAVQKAAGGHA